MSYCGKPPKAAVGGVYDMVFTNSIGDFVLSSTDLYDFSLQVTSHFLLTIPA